MVTLLFKSRGLRKNGNNEKKRKRVKRNEIPCMITLRSIVFFFFRQKNVYKGNINL